MLFQNFQHSSLEPRKARTKSSTLACVCACVRACVCAYVRACACVRACVCACVVSHLPVRIIMSPGGSCELCDYEMLISPVTKIDLRFAKCTSLSASSRPCLNRPNILGRANELSFHNGHTPKEHRQPSAATYSNWSLLLS